MKGTEATCVCKEPVSSDQARQTSETGGVGSVCMFCNAPDVTVSLIQTSLS